MEILFVLLKNYQSSGEAFVVGGLTALVISAAFAISGAIRNVKQKNKKDWDEVSKEETLKTDKNSKSDWD